VPNLTTQPRGVRVPPVSAFFRHMERFYDAMYEAADPATFDDGQQPYERLYKGHPTKLFEALGLPSPYYGKALSNLETMGCVTRLRRGARNAQSEIALHKRPTIEDFLALPTQEKSDNETAAQLIRDQQHRDLEKRVGDLEDLYKELAKKVLDNA